MPCRLILLSSPAAEAGQAAVWRDWLRHLEGRSDPECSVEADVRVIIEAVRAEGDAAVLAYTRRFDCPDLPDTLRVTAEAMAEAHARLAAERPDDLDAIRQAIAHIRAFHEAQRERSWFMTREDGTILGQKVVPVDRAGLYVPGGQGGNTPLISSLLMSAIPAQVAGVGQVAVVSPPRRDGTLNPAILAAAHELGVTEVYRTGGAWAIAALAYGTMQIPSVDVIAGPGNLWVTTAKRLVQGRVGIDMIAGPSEVLVLADAGANPAWVAADMLSQAEHDPLASALCLTDSPELANRVRVELERQLADLPRREIAAKALADWSAVVVTSSLDEAVALANETAPEHLELMVADPWAFLPRLRHAGAVFMGPYSPEPLGDYFAGPNHVLPTVGTARFSSALSVQTFCKRMSVIAASESFARASAEAVARLARMEQLEAHARSMESRR